MKKISEVVEVLKHQRLFDLEDMNLAAFQLMLHVDYMSLRNIISPLYSSAKKGFAVWVAADSEVADIILDGEEGFEILTKLLGVNKDEIIASLNRNVSDGNNFTEVALEEGNDIALEWVHDFFGKQCDPTLNEDSKQSYEECLFKQYYCALSLSAYYSEQLFDYDFFEDTLDTILEDHRPDNAPDWWTEEMEAIDLTGYVWKPVCKALGVGVEEAKPQAGEAG